MEKKKLKLSLKKNVISNLQSSRIVGGTEQTHDTSCDCGSECGCYTNWDETMTCCHYSCTCGGGFQ